MDDSLRRRIEKLQKSRSKIDTIWGKYNRELDSLREFSANEERCFEEYANRERRSLEKRLASERMALDNKEENKKRKIEERFKPMLEEASKLLDGVNSLGESTVSIRIGDLTDELVNLTGISTSDIVVKASSDIAFNEGHTDYKDSNDIWRLKLYSKHKGECSFYYEMMLYADLNSRQADGKTFLEHCNLEVCGERGFLHIDEANIWDLIINIPLSYFTIESDISWYPADIITQAVVNCVDKNNMKEVSRDTNKKRSRKLSK